MKHEYIAPTSSLVSLAPYEMLLGTSIEKTSDATSRISDPSAILSNEKDLDDSSFWDE